MYELLSYDVTEGIATVTFDRPNMRNALNPDLLAELEVALDQAESDDRVYVVLLTGSGSAFSAGGDIDTVSQWQGTERETFEAELGAFQEITTQLRSMRKPSVAAINGPAVGAGCDIALACDIRFVSPDAELTEGFVTIGLISGDGGAWLLPRLIGESRAKQYLLTGDPITADEAVDIGLAMEQVKDVVDRAREFAETIRDLPAEAVRWTKTLATATPESLANHQKQAMTAQWECAQDSEHQETLSARLNDRKPDLDR